VCSSDLDGAVFVEIGCYYGRSTLNVAQQIAQSGKQITLHCVDLWGDELQSKGKKQNGESIYEQFLINMKPYLPNITIHRGNSWDMAENFEDGSCDFVFIDADHEYESVLKDLTAWHPKVKRGGVIAGHDFFYKPVKKALGEFYGLHTINDIGEACWSKTL
jgi:predicted O-methyltransferase YrrM